MLRNYLTTAWRNLLKHRASNFLSIAGLALGLACFILISLYVAEEVSYDKGFDRSENIYRITDEGFGKNAKHWAATAPAVASSAKAFFPEINDASRLSYINTRVISVGDVKYQESEGYYADPNFLNLFGLKLAKGDARKALASVNTIVLTSAMAHKYFGNREALGQTILVTDGNKQRLLNVSGILKDISFNTHLKFDYLVSMPTLADVVGPKRMSSVTWNAFYTYIKLNESSSLKQAESKMTGFLKQFYAPLGISNDEILKAGKFNFQPVTDIHLHSNLEKEMHPNGDVKYVYIFSFAALLILFIACINFINLSTVQALKRIREIGVRKTMGASRIGLAMQFLSETVLQTIISIVIAIILVQLAIPQYEALTGKAVFLRQFLSLPFLLTILGILIIIPLLSGLYPAYFASRFDPVSALKGKGGTVFSVGLLRKGLVVLQFVISVALISGSIIIYQQMRLFSKSNLGFNKEHLIAVKLLGELEDKAVINRDFIKTQLENNPDISIVSLVSRVPGERLGTDGFELNDKSLPITSADIRYMWTDENYLRTMGIKLKEGQNFSGSLTDTIASFIVNEAAAKRLDLKSPVGQLAKLQGKTGKIVGVVEDFNFASLHSAVEPLVIQYDPTEAGYLLVKVRGEAIREVIPFIKENMKKVSSSGLFSYSFLDDNLDALYAAEERTGKIFTVFTIFAIVISCLGLFGLSSYSTKLRFKEVGVRKVLGASEASLISLLTKDFLSLVVVAIVIASPLCWWLMHSWLQDYAYRVEIHWWVFVAAGFAATLVAFVTVGFQAIKAALMNPVKSLRTE